MSTWIDPDLGKSPEELLAERTKRMQDAMQMKQPDRVPIFVAASYLVAEMAGITRQEQHEDFEKSQAALEQTALYFNADAIYGQAGDRFASEVLGDRMTKWPGYRGGPNDSFQFTEQEFMKAEDYDDFIFDPSDWGLRKYLPRAYSKLGGFAELPNFGLVNLGYVYAMNLFSFSTPAMAEALQAIGKAIEYQCASFEWIMKSNERLAALGFANPDFWTGLGALVPFDYMSDTLRGMKGIMLDMLKRPDKLLEAEQKVLKIQLDYVVSMTQAGFPYFFVPLHRGSDGFMSLKQFEKFYWPQFKEMIEKMAEAGAIPCIYFEGVWDQRLEYLQELPKGKTVGMFQSSDYFKVKEKVGHVMPIVGGMPVSMLHGGSVDEIRAHTKKLCEVVGKDGGFIMNSNVGELEGARPELVKAWVDATKEFGQY